MKPLTRILVAIASLSMISTYFLPLWQIQLWAPQYPEGLNMKIWHNHLSGAFDIINGLNHYIGMKLIKEEMFPEFAYIGILIGVYMGIGLLTAVSGKINLLKVFVATGIIYGAAALYDFYRWGYDYGHNLDPHAAIQVPGMSYQPPVVGYKNLLNFTAYSGPDLGGWVIIIASIISILLLFFEMRRSKTKSSGKKRNSMVTALLVAGSFCFSSCASDGPAPINYGKDQCAHCKMTLTDKRFGAEIITNTNKVYKFDDVNCLAGYLFANKEMESKVKGIYFINFNHEGDFIAGETSFYLQSDEIQSPMGSGIAVFASQGELSEMQKHFSNSTPTSWEKIKSSTE